jgi:hypothetical protein
MWHFVGGRLASDFSKNCRGFVFKEPDNGLLSVCASCGIEGEC